MELQEKFPELSMSKDRIHRIHHLLKAYLVNLMRKIIKLDPTRKKSGHLPKMVTASKRSTSVWLASSLCDRVELVANQLVKKENSLFSPDQVDILTTLWMSSDFM